jgi:hypothetical protein
MGTAGNQQKTSFVAVWRIGGRGPTGNGIRGDGPLNLALCHRPVVRVDGQLHDHDSRAALCTRSAGRIVDLPIDCRSFSFCWAGQRPTSQAFMGPACLRGDIRTTSADNFGYGKLEDVPSKKLRQLAQLPSRPCGRSTRSAGARLTSLPAIVNTLCCRRDR